MCVCVFFFGGGGVGCRLGASGAPGFRAAGRAERVTGEHFTIRNALTMTDTILEGEGGRFHGGHVCYEWAGSDAPRRLEALDIIILIVLCKNPCNSHKYAYPADSLHIGNGDQVGCPSLDIANMD